MSEIGAKLERLFRRKSVRYAIPFVVLVVGASFGMKEFAQLRYQFSRVSVVKRDELEKIGVTMKKAGEVTIETEYDKIKDVDTDNWQQVRIARPWEETQ